MHEELLSRTFAASVAVWFVVVAVQLIDLGQEFERIPSTAQSGAVI